FDQYQPLQSFVTQQIPQRSNEDIRPHEEASMEVLLAKERILKLIQAWDDKQIELWSLPELLRQVLNDSRTIDEMLKQREQTANLAVHVKNLVQILSEHEVTSDNESKCDVPVCEDSSTFDVLKDHSEILSDSNNDDTSSDDDAFEDIEYVEASFELTSLEEENDSSSSFPIFENSDNSLSYSDNSLPEFKTFSDHTEETRSGSTTSHANNSPPEYDSFCFEIVPNQEAVINNIDELNEDECFDPGGGEIDVLANIEDDDYFPFIFVIRIFLLYLIYPEVSPLLLSTGSEDTIFDPGISTWSRWHFIGIELSCDLMFIQTLMKARLRFSFPFAIPMVK
nr:hypothetical protein [Tanacetum cinerariifolium]